MKFWPLPFVRRKLSVNEALDSYLKWLINGFLWNNGEALHYQYGIFLEKHITFSLLRTPHDDSWPLFLVVSRWSIEQQTACPFENAEPRKPTSVWLLTTQEPWTKVAQPGHGSYQSYMDNFTSAKHPQTLTQIICHDRSQGSTPADRTETAKRLHKHWTLK